ncbi:MAG: hypothetical protein P8Z50_01515 [candidate division WOR-3 bacterium]|jgi:hypothetical protein
MKAIFLKIFKRIKDRIKQLIIAISFFEKGLATNVIEVELVQLENIFALILFGCFVGLPAPPVHLTLKLLPKMEKEMLIMMNRVFSSKDPIGELFSTLDIA